MTRVFVLVGFAVCAVAACSQSTTDVPKSSEHATSDLRFVVDIESNGGDVVADVRVDAKGVPCELDGDDRLVLRAADGTERALEKAGGFFEDYVAQIESTSTTLTLAFDRAAGETHASTFELPPPFVVAPPASLSRATPLQLTWTADAASSVVVEANGPCLGPRFSRNFTADPGSFALQPADFSPGGGCSVIVVVTRSHAQAGSGDLVPPPATALVRQVRTIVLETTP